MSVGYPCAHESHSWIVGMTASKRDVLRLLGLPDVVVEWVLS